jgi:hypothetical protein
MRARSVRTGTPFYSNLPAFALRWITLYKLKRVYPKAGKLCLGFAMRLWGNMCKGWSAGLCLSLNAMAGGGGVYSSSPHLNRIGILLDLRGGA